MKITEDRSGLVRSSEIETNSPETNVGTAEFTTELDAVLRTHEQASVSEEELFSALVGRQLIDRGLTTAEEYQSSLSRHLDPDSDYMPLESAAKELLGEMLDAETLTGEEANIIYSRAFRAAQLDDNQSFLFDHKASGSDITTATAARVDAVQKGLDELALLEEQEHQGERSVRELTPGVEQIMSSYGASVSSGESASPNLGLSGFLFKPQSESDGNLVILSPYDFTGKIATVRLTQDGELVEEGRFSGIANGNRSHYRFNQPGSKYPANLTVEFALDSGVVEEFLIRNPAERKEQP
jgi:hypothetical protein